MGSRLKEEEKNERIIRNLLKLADNRRCINCNSLGPQYVCTNFWTFICTNCSGIHREFTHRVKSISMAKFTSQEVSSLQGGGNAKAKEIYLKEWDAQKNSLPDASNVEKVRDFIKHVYVDRRYTGESRKSDTYQGGSPSPQYEDRFERRYSDKTSQGGRSPGWQQGDTKRSPARSEIVNDWRREDRFGAEKKYDEGRISDGSSMSGGRSPVHQVEPTLSSPPVVRPIRDILGDNAIPLRVIQPPKEDSSRSLDGSTRTQRTPSSSSLASSNGNSNELRKEASLIDFDAVAEMPATAPTPPVQNHIASMSVTQEATPLAADNWADFGAVSNMKASQAPSIASPFDSILSELAVPASAAAVGVSGTGTPSIEESLFNASAVPLNPSFINVPAAPMVTNSTGMTHGVNPLSANPASMSVLPANSGFLNATNSEQWMQQTHHLSASTGIGGLNPPQSFTPIFGVQPNHQQWDAQGPAHVSVAKSTFQPASTPDLKTTSESVGRIELAEDLFASPIASWQTGTPYGAGFNMQYNPMQAHQMHMSTFQQPSNSSNPFDVGGEHPNVQFPSMSSLQHALPNVGPSLPAVPGSYMGQQVPAVMPSRSPGPAGLGIEGSAFGGVNPTQHLGGLYSAPTNQHTFSSVGGNPFG